jgi:signal transduction histidine kinase
VSAVRRGLWADSVIAIAVFGLILVVPVIKPDQWHGRHPDHVTLLGVVVLGVACVALVFRRRWPRSVLAAAVACAVGYFAVGPSHGPTAFIVVIAMYTVTLREDRRAALVIAALTVVALDAGDIVLAGGTGADPNSILNVVVVGLAFALGDAMRNRRAYLAEVEERARRAEESREQEARRRVAEERLRIARDLHDVVAHHIALINVQAGVGAHLLDADPEQARQALVHIRRASRSALDELGATVGLLRESDDPAAPTDPTVGLARLDELIAGLAGCGLRVDIEIDGVIAGLPTAVDVTAYRIVQEALTNVHKHAGTDAVRLRFGVSADAVRILVEDDGGGAASTTGSGHGVLGMRERAAAVGGTLSAGPRQDGGFRVEATLPLPARYPVTANR